MKKETENYQRLMKFTLLFLAIFTTINVSSKTFYLDVQLASNCTGTYSIERRNNSGSDGDAYNNLQNAMDALNGGDTLIIRAGNYSRTGFDPQDPTEIGALDIGWSNSCNGTPNEHTVVMAYPGELPVILAEPGKDHYNPDPGDITYTLSSKYYNNPAIGIHGEYIDVSGLKTYGQVTITYANNIILEGCDLGGGGPHCSQGNVVVLNYGAHDIIIRNNLIHNSCWGENDDNGSAIICYHASATIENNEFYDNWKGDIYIKDTGGQKGRIIEIRKNFFRPSSIYADCVGYICHNQAIDIDAVYLHHNIFLEKGACVQWGTIDVADIPVVPYNNTFVNCTDVDLHAWGFAHQLRSYNNLFYHDNGSQRYYGGLYEEDTANWNLFYSTTNEGLWEFDGASDNTLAEWQIRSGQDENSVYKDPQFVDPSGNRPEDFKRQDYSGDVTGSSYSTICGAYETGNETIGLTSGGNLLLLAESYTSINNKVHLEQNFPNPFTTETEISLYMPQKYKIAVLCISNVEGQKIIQYDVVEKGNSSYIVNSNELTAGIYFYSVLIDNKVMDTKRMLLIKR